MVYETEQLRRAVQALAQPANVQIDLFPSFVVVGDELALDFGEAWDRFRAKGIGSLNATQQAAFEALDCKLDALSASDDEAFGLDREALERDPRWYTVRALASAVLLEMGWPFERPGASDATYIPSSGE